jgi:hypothetical protein
MIVVGEVVCRLFINSQTHVQHAPYEGGMNVDVAADLHETEKSYDWWNHKIDRGLQSVPKRAKKSKKRLLQSS